MRKLLLLLFTTLLIASSSFVKAQLVVTGNDSINVLCFNNSTGVAAADASGGMTPYTYSWAPSGGNGENADNLTAGTYTVTVIDATLPTSYTVTATVVITQTPAISISPNSSSATCGMSNGSASVTVSGGTGPYTYLWSDGASQTTAVANGLSGGLYNITVTDANGCAYGETVTVAQTSDIFVSVSGIVNEPCHGDCIGKATINASSSAPPYTYTWSSGQSTSNVTLLCAGVYTCTINDQNNCPTEELVTITQPAAIVVTTTVTANEPCFGDAVGSGEWLTMSGGTSPYTYYWSTSPTTSAVSISNLTAGTYVINVTDAHGCTGSGSITITQPAPVGGTITPTPPLCNGGDDGSATVNATGGTSPYTYAWSDAGSQTTVTATGLSAGTYSVAITDINGCMGTAIVTVPTPPPLTVNITPIPPPCYTTLGSATANPGGGTAPYTYAWSDAGSQSTATATGLSIGTYSITVTDNNGCTATATTTLTSPPQLTIINVNTYPLCNGGTGTDTAHVSGGISPYTYTWTPAEGADSIASGLSAGSYTITVNDANGCSVTTTINITQPPLLTVTITPTDPLCNGGLGSATANPTGGTAPYTYAWSDAGSQSTVTATGLSIGTYSVNVTDANGCNGTATTNIAQPTPVTGITTSTGEACNGNCTGTATVTGGGGTAPYSYSWSSGQSTTNATGLCAGIYTITITDANSCTGVATVNVTQPNIITATFNTTNIACNGVGTGSSTVIATGGTSPYTYAWSDAASQTTVTATGLSIGTYSVSITDINGCSGTGAITITEPTSLSVSAVGTNPACFGEKGTATANPAGGTAPYTYAWTGGQTDNPATGLAAGSYTVTVTDANGCTGSTEVTLTQPPLLTVTISSSNPSCNGGSVSATATATGGTVPYSYLWSDAGSQTTATATGLTAFSYTVLVVDANGCLATASILVTQPAPITTSFAITNPLCNGTTGSATSNPAGGSSPYTYAWNNTQSTQTATGLTAGTYSISITDINGCTGTGMATITQPNALGITSLTSTLDNCGDMNGTASVSVSGGTANYNYLWEPTGQTTTTATGLNAGTYTITVIDANGCEITETEVVNNTSTIAVSTTGISLLCNGADDGQANAIATGGVSPYTYDWSTLPSQTNASATGLTAGTYTVTLTDNTGCSCFAVYVVTQPTAISPATSTTPSNCANNAGTATVSATGGTGAYTYLWSDGETTTTIAGIGSGIYTVTVTDANGCSVTTTCTVNTHLGVTGFISSQTNVACFGDNIGGATLTITAGASPYTYDWSTGSITNSITNLSAGTYSVAVQDANGCIFTATVTISGPASPLTVVSITPTNSSCNNTADGSITFIVSGGSIPYTYSWTNHESGQTDTGLLPGSYTCTVTDANGCTIIDSADIAADLTVLAPRDTSYIVCAKGTVVTLTSVGSTNALTFAWYQLRTPHPDTLIGTTSTISVTPPLGTTVYELEAINGLCTAISYDTVYVVPVIANAGPAKDIFGFQSVTIGGSPTGSGGNAPYTYLWSPGSSMNDSTLFPNPTVSPSVTTVYTVLVTNAEGCTASDTVTVFVFADVTVPTGFSPNGDGINDTWILPFAYAFPTIQVQVYNRWGELLFNSNGYTVPWNGEYNGKPLPIGTYYYIIQLNNPRFPTALTGPVTILR